MPSVPRRLRSSREETSQQISRSIKAKFQRQTKKRRRAMASSRWLRAQGHVAASSVDGWSKRTRKPKPSGAARSQPLTFRYLMFVYYLDAAFITDNGSLTFHIFSLKTRRLSQIPVYSHLRIHPTVAINLPRTIPKCLETNNLPNLQYIFLEPDEIESEMKFSPSK
jgi:hypothetical protein